MEKGFNDQELADIMSEIEDLEKEFNDDEREVEAKVEASEPKASSPVTDKPKLVSKDTSGHAHHSSMEFKLEGEMKMAMKFHVEDSSVELVVNKDHVEITMENGAKFSLPLNCASHSHKKAA